MIVGTLRILPAPDRRADVLEVFRAVQGPVRDPAGLRSPATSTRSRARTRPSCSSRGGSPRRRSRRTSARRPTAGSSAPSSSRAAPPEVRFEHVSATAGMELIEQSRAPEREPGTTADRREAMKVIIVGGVAGGASCAARLRRLDEKAEILMVERGPYVSYANCGLPYHVGGRDPGGVEPAGGDRADVPRRVRRRRADELRGDRHLAEEEDRGPAQRRDRRGDDRVLRQARAVARRGPDPPAAARHRPSRDLLGADRPGRPDHPRVAAPRRGGEDRDGLVHRASRS